jgi:hypothetical protein
MRSSDEGCSAIGIQNNGTNAAHPLWQQSIALVTSAAAGKTWHAVRGPETVSKIRRQHSRFHAFRNACRDGGQGDPPDMRLQEHYCPLRQHIPDADYARI